MIGVQDIEYGQQTTWYHDNQLCCKAHTGSSYPKFGPANAMQKGSVIGISLDMTDGTLAFSSNGKSFGTVNSLQPKNDYRKGTWVLYIGDGSSAANMVQATILDKPRYQ